MMSHLMPISALLAGTALMLLGTGLLNTLLALRGSREGVSDQMLGMIGSASFVGFFAGTFVAPALIRHMNHIRAFAFFAAAVAICVLAHALVVDAAFWMLLRVITGIALVGFYTVIESWLNAEVPSARRGQMFSIYMMVNLLALAAAQQLLSFDSPAVFTLFAVAAIFVVMSLMPVVLTRLPPPQLKVGPRLALRGLWKAAPVALVGALASGLAMGAFWGMGAVYASRAGLDDAGVARFISVTILAGALLQWPMGKLSDRIDRCWAARRTIFWWGPLFSVVPRLRSIPWLWRTSSITCITRTFFPATPACSCCMGSAPQRGRCWQVRSWGWPAHRHCPCSSPSRSARWRCLRSCTRAGGVTGLWTRPRTSCPCCGRPQWRWK